jgi:hypothetical protein
MIFALTYAAGVYLLGVVAGCTMGYAGGKTDLYGQRLTEIWSLVPFLYMVMIAVSLLPPEIALMQRIIILLLIMVVFSWTGLATYMRTVTLKEKSRDYVAAAALLGASNARLIFRHVLPNAMVATLTMLPFIVSGTIGSLAALDYLGYGLPASIGVQIAHPEALVINVAGEASWLMNMQEMGTAMQFRAPVKQFILNNERLGMVRQWQELLHGERYSQSWSESLPDFVKLAEAFGCKGIRIDDPADLDEAIKEMLAYNGPVIFDCRVEKHENCFPMIPSGKPHNEMLLGDADTQGVIGAKGAVLV